MKFLNVDAALRYVLQHTSGPRHAINAAAAYITEQAEKYGNDNSDALYTLQTRVAELEADLATANAVIARQQTDLIRLAAGTAADTQEAPKPSRKRKVTETISDPTDSSSS